MDDSDSSDDDDRASTGEKASFERETPAIVEDASNEDDDITDQNLDLASEIGKNGQIGVIIPPPDRTGRDELQDVREVDSEGKE